MNKAQQPNTKDQLPIKDDLITVFNEYTDKYYPAVSFLMNKEEDWVGHLYEIRSQIIAENLFEDTEYEITEDRVREVIQNKINENENGGQNE